ncbi:MAG: thiamine pyrophosphate-dependent dehydrogenase E1 component subunit alpha [Gemmatimonadota bacterium]|nr:thiamine pyrophosphate-dependent dehydrogenase E1 component subunit alpha [Gemmatimonadota bacterium]
MKRHTPFEPPEYIAWKPDEAGARAFREAVTRDQERAAVVATLSREALLGLYRGLVRNRLTDIALKRMVRQGVISKAWLGTGEEATTIGPVHALSRDGDVVAPMIRNAGACHEMGMPVGDILRAYMATEDGPNRGRDGHYGSFARGVIPPISHVGDMVPVIAGIALSFKARGRSTPQAGTRVALTWIGDGTTKVGVTHEALNFAAVHRVPAVFIIQNNQVALGTRLDQHHVTAGQESFAAWPRAYGMWGGVFDGNNVLDAYALTALAVARCRRGEGPALLVAETFRMGGHATHDEAEARATFHASLFEHWGRRDPIALYEEWLVENGVTRDALEAIEAEVQTEVERAETEALDSKRTSMPKGESAVEGVYAEQ